MKILWQFIVLTNNNIYIYIYIYIKCWLGNITKKKRPMNNENWSNQKNKCSYYCSFTHSYFCYKSVVKIIVDVALIFSQYLLKAWIWWKHKNLFRPPIKRLQLDCFYYNLSKYGNKSKWSTINWYYYSA